MAEQKSTEKQSATSNDGGISKKIELIIAKAHDPSSAKMVELNRKSLSIESILKAGKNHLNMKRVSAAYKSSGDQIHDVNHLESGDRVFISSGATMEEQSVLNICMLGSGAVGKSALTLQYIQGQFISDYDPTIEDAYRKPINVDGSPLLLDILDTAGQEDFFALRASWIRDKDGIVLAFSIVQRKSFDELKQFYDLIVDVYDDNPPPIILVGNKCDLDNVEVLPENPKLYRRKVTVEEALELARKWRCIEYIETSAMLGTRVSAMYGSLVRHMISTRIQVNDNQSGSSGGGKKWYEKCAII